MLVAVGAMVLLTIIGTIVMTIGGAIGMQITGEGSVDELGRSDERDEIVTLRGDRVGYTLSGFLMLGVLIITMLGAVNFWIANAMFASFLVTGIVVATVKIVAYRRGF